jgi:hypothetical protein
MIFDMSGAFNESLRPIGVEKGMGEYAFYETG